MKFPISISVTHLGQAILLAMHVLNIILPQVPEKWKGLVAGLLALGNWYLAYLAHNSSPSGNALPPNA
jgi:hypothetical protein